MCPHEVIFSNFILTQINFPLLWLWCSIKEYKHLVWMNNSLLVERFETPNRKQYFRNCTGKLPAFNTQDACDLTSWVPSRGSFICFWRIKLSNIFQSAMNSQKCLFTRASKSSKCITAYFYNYVLYYTNWPKDFENWSRLTFLCTIKILTH